MNYTNKRFPISSSNVIRQELSWDCLYQPTKPLLFDCSFPPGSNLHRIWARANGKPLHSTRGSDVLVFGDGHYVVRLDLTYELEPKGAGDGH